MPIKNTSQEIKKISFSHEIYEKVEKIEKKFSLHIDQTGELYSEIVGILERKIESKNFIRDIIDRLEINQDLANQIATEVNKEIFDAIKSNLQSQTESNESTISSIEQAGNFRVEKEAPEQNNNSVTPADRAKILAGVEDPQTSTRAQTSNFSVPLGSIPKLESNPSQENYTEPLVDYLLANPIAQSEKKVTVETKDAVKDTAPQVKTAPTTPAVPRKQGPDPYREAIK